MPAAGLFQHPLDPVDEGDFDNDKEQKLIVSLTRHHEDQSLWHAQCITIWADIVDAAAKANQADPMNPRTVWEQYPNLFQYLVDGAPNFETVLTPYEVETGRVDLKTTIPGRTVVYMATYEKDHGNTELDPALQAYYLAGEEWEEIAPEAKPVSRSGVPVLYFEKGLLQTIMERADYGESDLFDNNHTLLLKDLTDQEVYTHTILLEQVTDLA